jgi:hypothetical protein
MKAMILMRRTRGSVFINNYQRGTEISYSTNLSVYPLTFKDIAINPGAAIGGYGATRFGDAHCSSSNTVFARVNGRASSW